MSTQVATFPAATSAAAKPETHLLRGIAFGIAIQTASFGAIAGAWMMVRHF